MFKCFSKCTLLYKIHYLIISSNSISSNSLGVIFKFQRVIHQIFVIEEELNRFKVEKVMLIAKEEISLK